MWQLPRYHSACVFSLRKGVRVSAFPKNSLEDLCTSICIHRSQYALCLFLSRSGSCSRYLFFCTFLHIFSTCLCGSDPCAVQHIFQNVFDSGKASPMAQQWVCLWMQVRSLGLEDPLEEGMATHSSILAWRIPWTEEPGGLQSMGSQRVGHN